MQRRTGFTMVELLIYIGISTLALVVFTSFMITTTIKTGQARQSQGLQQNARFVLDRLSQVMRSATTVSTTANSITAGATIIFYDSANKKITIGGADITSTLVAVDSFSVSPVPAQVPPLPQLISVSFTISTKNTSPVQSLPVTTTLVPHNQLYQ